MTTHPELAETVRYERRSSDQDLAGAPRRTIAILVVVVLLVGGTIGAVLATNSSDPPPSVADRPAIVSAFVAANIFLENIGAPPPVGVTDARWPLRSVPLIGSGAAAHLAVHEHDWRGDDGAIILLSTAQAASLTAAQAGLINGLFVGSLRSQVLDELHEIVRGEQRSAGKIASPGGARVTQWISVTERGNRATAEAVVAQWVQQDQVSGSGGDTRINTSIMTGAVDAIATLVRIDGSWRLNALRQPPFQQPT